MGVRYNEKAAMESCKRANMTNAALVIESLMQQRAELLEALKKIKGTTGMPYAVVNDEGGAKLWAAICEAHQESVKAITKAEEAE